MANLDTIGGLHYEMMRRCYNEKSVMYAYYGAKGIKVCDEWHDRENFKLWAKDNGYEKGMRLDRIDASKDYEPSNCLFGRVNTKIVDGKNQRIKNNIKKNKTIKADLGIERFSEHPLYRTFYGMHTRCENSNHTAYQYYGGKGIKVCEEWSGKNGFVNFVKWVKDEGSYKEGLTIDRIDSDKDYCPDNCRWVSMKEQSLNKKSVKVIEYLGKKYSISGLCKRFGLNKKLFEQYLENGLSVESAYYKSKNSGTKGVDI